MKITQTDATDSSPVYGSGLLATVDLRLDAIELTRMSTTFAVDLLDLVKNRTSREAYKTRSERAGLPTPDLGLTMRLMAQQLYLLVAHDIDEVGRFLWMLNPSQILAITEALRLYEDWRWLNDGRAHITIGPINFAELNDRFVAIHTAMAVTPASA